MRDEQNGPLDQKGVYSRNLLWSSAGTSFIMDTECEKHCKFIDKSEVRYILSARELAVKDMIGLPKQIFLP